MRSLKSPSSATYPGSRVDVSSFIVRPSPPHSANAVGCFDARLASNPASPISAHKYLILENSERCYINVLTSCRPRGAGGRRERVASPRRMRLCWTNRLPQGVVRRPARSVRWRSRWPRAPPRPAPVVDGRLVDCPPPWRANASIACARARARVEAPRRRVWAATGTASGDQGSPSATWPSLVMVK